MTANPGGKTCIPNPATLLFCWLTEVSPNTTYSFTVTATNAVGTSAPSAAGTVVVPGLPGQVTGLKVVPGDGQVTLSWTAPPSDGGAAITRYNILSYLNGIWSMRIDTLNTATSRVWGGLQNGVPAGFTVAATNPVGSGPASALVTVTPMAGLAPTPTPVPPTPTPNPTTAPRACNGIQATLLVPGARLTSNQSITSPGGRYKLLYQTDANLVLYDGTTPLWASGTSGAPGFAIMQGNGSLESYDASGRIQWGSGTGNHPGAWAALQIDGKLVVYDNCAAAWVRP
jgi:hypothetical protein